VVALWDGVPGLMVKWLAGSPGEWDSPYRWVRGLRRVGLIPLFKGIPLCDKRTFRGKFGVFRPDTYWGD